MRMAKGDFGFCLPARRDFCGLKMVFMSDLNSGFD